MEITTLKNPSRKPYIYKVTSFETGQYYIGSQCRGKTIGHNYFTSSTNKEFMEGFKTYKEEKYKIEIVREFEDPDECVRAENYVIRNYTLKKDGLCLNRFYCCNGKKIFSAVGLHHSEETKQKISLSNKGTHRSEETKHKMSEAHKGTHLSEETKQKLSETLKGHPTWDKGTHRSEETKHKMSEAHKGIPATNRIKISIEGVAFSSITEASKYYNVSDTAISRWLKTKKHNAFYVK